MRVAAGSSNDDALARCRGCGRFEAAPVLDLGNVPASDYFPSIDDPGEDPRWPLQLYMCRTCTLVQLGPSAHPEPEAPKAIESATALAHAAASAAQIFALEGMRSGDRVIEIDSHHGGSWLGGFRGAGMVVRGPDEVAELVADVHGIAHEPDLRGPLAAHVRRLVPGGRLVMEFHHLLPMVEQAQIDTVRHGHWVYLSLRALARLLPLHGLMPVRAVPVDVFGGSLRVTAARVDDHPQVDASVAEVLEAERRAGLDETREPGDFRARWVANGSRVCPSFEGCSRTAPDSGGVWRAVEGACPGGNRRRRCGSPPLYGGSCAGQAWVPTAGHPDSDPFAG